MYKRLCLVVAFLALTSCADGKGENQVYRNHTFQAEVKKVRLQSQLLKQGKKNTDKVSVQVPAILFDQPIRIADVRNVDESFSPEIDFFAAYIKANIEGSKSDILSYWHASAKGHIQEMLNNDELFRRNQAYTARNPGLVAYGLIRQKDTIALLQGRTAVFGITMKEENGKLFLVEKPKDDLELAIIEASFIR